MQNIILQNECQFNYQELFMKQLVQTLAQIAAGLLSSSIAIPLYSYYKTKFMSNSFEDLDFDDDDEENDDDQVGQVDNDNDNDDDDDDDDLEEIEDIDSKNT
jgi:hypothetical protein